MTTRYMPSRYLPSRYLPSVGGATVMTFGLFFVMQLLVSGQMIPTVPMPRMPVIQTPKKIVTPPKTEAKLPPKIKVQSEPADTKGISDPRVKEAPRTVFVPGGVAGPGIGNNGLDETVPGPGGNEMMPLFIVPPVYPPRAQMDGIEGFVVLEFAVDELGNVNDPHVLYAEPERIFGKAAIKAILKSRFKARIMDGRAVAVAGVRYKYVFRIE